MSGFRKIGHGEHDQLLRSAVSVTEHEDPVEQMAPALPPGALKQTRRKVVEVPYTETVQVPVHTKVHTKNTEEKIVTGIQLVPVQKYKDVKETVTEYKEERVKGVKVAWVKKEIPYETVVRKPVQVVKTRRVPYTDYEEKKVQVKVSVPSDKLEVRTGYREDKVTKTKLVEVEQDLHLHHGPVVVREGTPRMREIPGGRHHGVTSRGKDVIDGGTRLRTGPDAPHRSYSSGALTPPSSTVSMPAGHTKEWRVRLNKPEGEAFGMKFDCSDGETIMVTKVKKNHFMSAWNQANPDSKLQKGDRIVEVNGVRGSAKKLMDICTRSGGPLQVTIQGPRLQTPMPRSSSLPQVT